MFVLMLYQFLYLVNMFVSSTKPGYFYHWNCYFGNELSFKHFIGKEMNGAFINKSKFYYKQKLKRMTYFVKIKQSLRHRPIHF